MAHKRQLGKTDMPEPNIEESRIKSKARLRWFCHCPAPHNERTGPGLCLSCNRFPFQREIPK